MIKKVFYILQIEYFYFSILKGANLQLVKVSVFLSFFWLVSVTLNLGTASFSLLFPAICLRTIDNSF